MSSRNSRLCATTSSCEHRIETCDIRLPTVGLTENPVYLLRTTQISSDDPAYFLHFARLFGLLLLPRTIQRALGIIMASKETVEESDTEVRDRDEAAEEVANAREELKHAQSRETELRKLLSDCERQRGWRFRLAQDGQIRRVSS